MGKTVAAAGFLLGAIQLWAQSPEDQSLVSTNLTDSQLIEYSKSEIRFASAALGLVQGRICEYAEGAKTAHGQAFISELLLPRAVVPPQSFCLSNAISAGRLYLQFTNPPELSAGEQGAAWTELGFAVLDRVNSVLHHYYLAIEYRRGHEPALKELRASARGLADYLGKRNGTAGRLAEIKARYAALWFEKCEEVLAVYTDIIGGGAPGAVRDALVLRAADLPLVTAWTWEERKKAEAAQKQFVQQLSASKNPFVRMEGLLLALARARTDRAYATAFTNVLDGMDESIKPEGTRTAYVNVIKELLEDRQSKALTDKTRNELKSLFDTCFSPVPQSQTNAPATTNATAVASATGETNAVKAASVAHRATAKAVAGAPGNKKGPPSWQLLMAPTDIQFWEAMPLPEVRALAAKADPVANYYVYLKLRNSDQAGATGEADAALDEAYKAGLPQAELAHANRLTDAEERFYWTRKAASTGYPAAQLALGKLHILGHGTPADLERGLSLVRASYDLKVPEAEAVLAELYACGVGDPRTARERPENLFFTAARNNQKAAMMELHLRYLNGYGVARDQLEACRWLVNVGLHDKEVLTKYLDDSGRATPQGSLDLDRFAKTLAVYAQAIVYKQPEAITHVAEWYATGSVGRKSPVRAYALLSLAGNSEKIKPEAVQSAKSALTPQQLKTAEILASQWQRIQPDLL